MQKTILSILFATLFTPLLDAPWLLTIGGKYYKKELGTLVKNPPAVLPGLLVYLCLGLAIGLLALPQTAPEYPLGKSALYGALVGFVAYGVYEGTNMSLIQGWSAGVFFVDILWGTFVCALSAAATAYMTRRFF